MLSKPCDECKGYEYGICHIQCSEIRTVVNEVLANNEIRKILGLPIEKPRKWWKFYW